MGSAEAILRIGRDLTGGLRNLSHDRLQVPSRVVSLAGFVIVLTYASVMQWAILNRTRSLETRHETWGLHVELTKDSIPLTRLLPGFPGLMAISNSQRRLNANHQIGMRIQEHKIFARTGIEDWSSYEQLEPGTFPSDAVASMMSVGIVPFYLPGLTVIDELGLVDPVVARNQHVRSTFRQMAHDRYPPPGYLHERGVNIRVFPAASSSDDALHRADYAVPFGQGLWMPFDATDREWAEQNFTDKGLVRRYRLSAREVAGNLVEESGTMYEGVRFLGRFDRGSLEGWSLVGEAVTPQLVSSYHWRQQPIFGYVGQGLLTTYHPAQGDRVTGTATSQPFRVKGGGLLAFLVAGGRGPGVGVRLLGANGVIETWHGRNSEHFELVTYRLEGEPEEELWIEVFDDDTGAWGHVMLDHVLLMRPGNSAE
jgi:hypothetical protein